MSTIDAVIVGGGIAGLVCAARLHQAGKRVRVCEASDAAGGRMRTDVVDGFRIDRGFQVLLDSYPEARTLLDYEALDLHPFTSGALIRYRGRFHRLADPNRNVMHALSALMCPVGTLRDKRRVLSLRKALLAVSEADIERRAETTTIEYLHAYGFSDAIIDRFFRPFLAGVFLEKDLQTSSRFFEFIFRLFATGRATLPGAGMQRVPEQLARSLPEGCVECNAHVDSVDGGGVTLRGARRIDARAVVIATDFETCATLLKDPTPRRWRSTVCVTFAADHPPLKDPLLILSAEEGPINNAAVISNVAPGYAPQRKALFSASVVGDPAVTDAELEAQIRAQCRRWFGAQVDAWRHLRTDRIRCALPAQPVGVLDPVSRAGRIRTGLYRCGDWLDTASINGAMRSGRLAADAVLADHAQA